MLKTMTHLMDSGTKQNQSDSSILIHSPFRQNFSSMYGNVSRQLGNGSNICSIECLTESLSPAAFLHLSRRRIVMANGWLQNREQIPMEIGKKLKQYKLINKIVLRYFFHFWVIKELAFVQPYKKILSFQ